MKIEEKHIKLIRKEFAELQTKEDFLALLNRAKKIMYGDNTRSFHLRSLTYYANPKTSKKRYTQFSIKKKNGSQRTINTPVSGLKSILRVFNFVLQCVFEPHKAATGFVGGKSIVDNAKMHVGNRYVYNIDLKDFFHSFDRNKVKLGFMYKPFHLRGEREPLAFMLASLVTHPFDIEGKTRIVLPQGSPTSPTVSNILCMTLDRRLSGLANRFGIKYSRYADDITFSSPHNIYNNDDFLSELKRIVEDDQKLFFNPDKTRLQKAAYRQEVTGLIVNEKVNVKSRYVKQIRMWIYYWEKYGFEKATLLFKKDYLRDKGHIKKGEPNLVNVLDGKLQYLKMVKGKTDSTYLKLQARLEKLAGPIDPINEVLRTWEKEGIDKAIELFYQKK